MTREAIVPERTDSLSNAAIGMASNVSLDGRAAHPWSSLRQPQGSLGLRTPGGSTSYWGSASVMSNHGAFDPT